ncbi:hypothetical protein ACI8AK_05135 [Geodermatophilus sp. SYSU D00867]
MLTPYRFADRTAHRFDEARIYTVTELNQRTAPVLEEINRRGKPAAVTRHGKFLAMITPLVGAQVESVVLTQGELAERFVREARDVQEAEEDSGGLLSDEEVATRSQGDRWSDAGQTLQQAMPHRFDEAMVYTVTELNQRTAPVLEEINRRGKPAAVTRHGKFLAMITPLVGAQVESVVLTQGELAERFVREARDVQEAEEDSGGLLSDEEVATRSQGDRD